MVRQPYIDSTGTKKGAWSKEEDDILRSHVDRFGHPNWRLLPLLAGLVRCGKSCRLRWENYLKPGLKRGKFSQHEVDLVIKLHNQLGNRWSAIAAKLPGRTDNEIKNYWHAHISKHRKRRSAVSITTENHQKESVSEDEVLQGLSAESMDVVVEAVADSCSVEDETLLGQFDIDPPPYLDELDQFDGLGLRQIYHMFLLYDSSPSLNASWNSTITERHGDFWSEPNEEDTFDVALW